MGLSYDVIERSTRQVVATFPLNWLRDSQLIENDSIPNLEQNGMVGYCQDLIDKISGDLDELFYQQSCQFLDLKKTLLEEIRESDQKQTLSNILIKYQDKVFFDDLEERITILREYTQKLLAFQNFLVPYLFDKQYLYKGELSY
jgi:hypothetical protein